MTNKSMTNKNMTNNQFNKITKPTNTAALLFDESYSSTNKNDNSSTNNNSNKDNSTKDSSTQEKANQEQTLESELQSASIKGSQASKQVEPSGSAKPSDSKKRSLKKLQQSNVNANTNIKALSLTVKDLEDRIPTLKKSIKQQEPTPQHQIGNKKRDYLITNRAIADTAKREAEQIQALFEEAKTTQAYIRNIYDTFLDHKTSNQLKFKDLDTRIHDCELVASESQKIAQQIQKLSENANGDTEQLQQAQLQQVAKAFDEAQGKLKAAQSQIDEKHQENPQSHQQLQNEIRQCVAIRENLEQFQKKEQALHDKNSELSKTLQKGMSQLSIYTTHAARMLKESQEKLNLSKNGQSSYLELNQKVLAMQSDLAEQAENTSKLSSNLNVAQEAIATNESAVQQVTDDVNAIKVSLLENDHLENKEQMVQLLSKTQDAHHRLGQLLEINNNLSQRLVEYDSNLQVQHNNSRNNQKSIAETAEDLNEQKTHCKTLIDQVDQSHKVVTLACQKTNAINDQLEKLLHEDQKHRSSILIALKDLRSQKKSIKELTCLTTAQNSYQNKQTEQVEGLIAELCELQNTIGSTYKQFNTDHETLKTLVPRLEQQETSLSKFINEAQDTIKGYKESHNKFNELFDSMKQEHADHSKQSNQQLENVENQLKKHQQAHDDRENTAQKTQQQLELLEETISEQLEQLKTVESQITEGLDHLHNEQVNNAQLLESVEFKTTELGYLKDQCDQLLNQSIDQNKTVKSQTESLADIIKQATSIQTNAETAITKQHDIAIDFEHIAQTVNTTLADINAKNKMTYQTHQQALESLEAIKLTQANVALQTAEHKSIQVTLKQSMAELDEQQIAMNSTTENIEQLKHYVEQQAKDQHKLFTDQSATNKKYDASLKQYSSQLDQYQQLDKKVESRCNSMDELQTKAETTIGAFNTQTEKLKGAFRTIDKRLTQYQDKFKDYSTRLDQTDQLVEDLQESKKTADNFAEWTQSIRQEVDSKLKAIDDYQRNAYQHEQQVKAYESKLSQQYDDMQTKMNMLEESMANLESIRQEEAQYRDELRAIAQNHEYQQNNVTQQLNESHQQHHELSQSIDDAHLMFRENKLATQETFMANRETKIVLQEIRKEITQLKHAGLRSIESSKISAPQLEQKFRQDWSSERRIENLENSFNSNHNNTSHNNTHNNTSHNNSTMNNANGLPRRNQSSENTSTTKQKPADDTNDITSFIL